MAKLENLKVRVKGMASEAKDWFDDYKFEIAFYGITAGILVGGIALGQHYSKKYEKAWRAAKEAYENGHLDQDFGPYKLMKFFEPKTGEFIGETMCHEASVKSFLNLK